MKELMLEKAYLAQRPVLQVRWGTEIIIPLRQAGLGVIIPNRWNLLGGCGIQ